MARPDAALFVGLLFLIPLLSSGEELVFHGGAKCWLYRPVKPWPSWVMDSLWSRVYIHDKESNRCCIKQGYRRVCKDEQSSYATPTAWLGSAPLCDSSPYDCWRIGMEYVRRHRRGSGRRCWLGRKVLCKPYPAVNDLVDTPANVLKVMSYNVMEKAWKVDHSGQMERTCRIPAKIVEAVSDLDVVVFQEAFMGGCIPKSLPFSSLMKHYGFFYTSEVLGRYKEGKLRQIEDGGIIVSSKWPIVKTETIIFEESGSFDQFAEKGAIYVEIEKFDENNNRKRYHIIGTHLFSGSELWIKRSQLYELAEFITMLSIPKHEPVIMAGDFNIDAEHSPEQWMDALVLMSADQPKLIGDIQATWAPSNDWTWGDTGLLIDNVVYSERHGQPVYSSLEILALKSDDEMHVCVMAPVPIHVFGEQPVCLKRKDTRDLSDHYPIVGTFHFSEE